MKKFLLLLIMSVFLIQPLYAETPEGQVIDLLSVGGVTSISVPGISGATFSNSFPMKNVNNYALMIQSSATSKFNVVLENAFARPTTEATTDTATFTAVESTTPNLTVSDTAIHIFSFNPINSPYGRFRFTGLTGNSNTNTITTLKVYIPKQK